MKTLDEIIKKLEKRYDNLVHQSLDQGYNNNKLLMNGRVMELEFIIEMLKKSNK